METNNPRNPHTQTLARLYEAQGLSARIPHTGKKHDSGPVHADKRQEEFAKLAVLMGQWIDLLRRRRFLETKP